MTHNANAFRSIFVFALSAFAVGLSEFIVIGLLSQIAVDLHASLAEAGLLVTVYAAAISFGAPVTTRLTRRFAARPLCIALLLAFAIASGMITLVAGLAAVLVARAFAGVVHGTFFSVASSSIPTLVGRDRAVLAIALMFSGLTLAMVLGVPMGVFIAETFGWRIVFLAISALSALSAGLILIFVPKTFGQTALRRRAPKLNAALLQLYLVTIFGFGGGFMFYSYAEPWLANVAGLNTQQISIVLGLIGGGSLIGNILGGILPSRFGLNGAVCLMIALQAGCLAIFGLHVTGITPQLLFFLWAVATFSLAPMVQAAAVEASEAADPRLSASFNVAAFNLGIAGASYLGSLQLGVDGLGRLPFSAAILVLIALPFAIRRMPGLSVNQQGQSAC